MPKKKKIRPGAANTRAETVITHLITRGSYPIMVTHPPRKGKDKMAKKIDYASMFTLRKDGRYQGYYTDKDGKRHAVCDKDPEQLFHKLQAKKIDDTPEVITFGFVLDKWEKEHREEIEVRTWKNYEPHVRYLRDKYGKYPLDSVIGIDVQKELEIAQKQGRSRTVVNTIRSIFNMVFDHAIRHDYIRYNPAQSVRLPKGLKAGKRKGLTDDEMITICQNIDVPFGLFPFFLLCTGVRKSEALALTWSHDIDFKNEEIQIQKSRDTTFGTPSLKSPKTEAGYRTIPMIPVLVEPLKWAYKNRINDLVFPAPPSTRGGPGGGMIKDRQYEGLWDRYCKSAGFWDGDSHTVTAHRIRHATATLMFETGVDEKTAQKVLGHSHIEVTREIYTELREQQQGKSMDRFNAGMAKLMANRKTR